MPALPAARRIIPSPRPPHLQLLPLGRVTDHGLRAWRDGGLIRRRYWIWIFWLGGAGSRGRRGRAINNGSVLSRAEIRFQEVWERVREREKASVSKRLSLSKDWAGDLGCKLGRWFAALRCRVDPRGACFRGKWRYGGAAYHHFYW